MFTGIVQTTAPIVSFQRNTFGARLTVDRAHWTPAGGYQIGHGDSICVSGVCLTVVEFNDQTLTFDVIAETLDKTNLGQLKQGDLVNLEPAVLPSQPMGGHFMQGHVDGLGTVTHVKDTPEEWRTTIEPADDLMDFIVPKGSIAIDGISLTIAATTETTFDVALIPTTLELTTLAQRKVGESVNLEADILAKTVVHHLKRAQGISANSTITRDLLSQAGFGAK